MRTPILLLAVALTSLPSCTSTIGKSDFQKAMATAIINESSPMAMGVSKEPDTSPAFEAFYNGGAR